MSDTSRVVQIFLKRPMIRVALVLLGLSILVASHLRITLSRLGDASSNLRVITQEAWPPDFSVVTDRASWAYPPCELQTDWMCSPAVVGMTQT
ncbi:MAG: hypothetical protein VX402_03685, partial [Candidatus Thermoplasmatota archaeon]|nr:hypothetical protein [Candidatus Thermoplasmatota archaeon]